MWSSDDPRPQPDGRSWNGVHNAGVFSRGKPVGSIRPDGTSQRVSTVLLCAEDDDLELIELVHLGRKHGLELEVVPGIEAGDAPLVASIDRYPQALFVLIRSDNLDPGRAALCKARFERLHQPGQQMLSVRLDPGRVADLALIVRGRVDQMLGVREGGRNNHGPRPRRVIVNIPTPRHGSELDITQRVGSHDETLRDAVNGEIVVAEELAVAAAPVRRGFGPLLLMLALGLLAGAAGWAWLNGAL